MFLGASVGFGSAGNLKDILHLVHNCKAQSTYGEVGFGGSGSQTDLLNCNQLSAKFFGASVGFGGSGFQKDILNFVHNCEAQWAYCEVGFGGSGFQQKNILNLVHIGECAYCEDPSLKDILNLVHNCGRNVPMARWALVVGLLRGGLRWLRLPEGHLELGAHLQCAYCEEPSAKFFGASEGFGGSGFQKYILNLVHMCECEGAQALTPTGAKFFGSLGLLWASMSLAS